MPRSSGISSTRRRLSGKRNPRPGTSGGRPAAHPKCAWCRSDGSGKDISRACPTGARPGRSRASGAGNDEPCPIAASPRADERCPTTPQRYLRQIHGAIFNARSNRGQNAPWRVEVSARSNPAKSGLTMSKTPPDEHKRIVLEGFGALFYKYD